MNVVSVEQATIAVSGNAPAAVIVADRQAASIVTAGAQGPAGRQGDIGPAGGTATTETAGEALGGHRIARLDAGGDAVYASNDVPADALSVLGLTLGAAVLGDPIDVQRMGEVTEPSWTWSLDQPVYLGTNGGLTQTAPSAPAAAFQLIVGFPVSATTLFVSLREPIYF